MSRFEVVELKVILCVLIGLLGVCECTSDIEGKTLKPIYWNSSNPLFELSSKDSHQIDASINDKLDIICPSKLATSSYSSELFYFKLYLVSKDNFEICNATNGRRLLTCNLPNKEKKYTFFFQKISPSPWGLEFTPEQSYYVISTSTGISDGIDNQKGGVCTQFNMRLELKIHEAEDPLNIYDYPYDINTGNHNDDKEANSPDKTKDRTNNNGKDEDPSKNEFSNPTLNEDKHSNRDGLIIGVVLGAFAVLFILLLVYFVYKIYGRHRYNKKYHSPSITPTRSPVDHLDQHVTLLPIMHPDHRIQHVDRPLPSRERLRSATLSTHAEIRLPPSYNESFLENGGTVACV